jgi:predicted NBD/HSP70 family sugar kinase
MNLRVGIDIGSTTVKVVVLDEDNRLLFRSYERHYSKARERAAQTLKSMEQMLAGQQVRPRKQGRPVQRVPEWTYVHDHGVGAGAHDLVQQLVKHRFECAEVLLCGA